jgi:hypothetical protein
MNCIVNGENKKKICGGESPKHKPRDLSSRIFKKKNKADAGKEATLRPQKFSFQV